MVIAFDTAHKSIAKDLRAQLGAKTEPLASRKIVRVESLFPDTNLVDWLREQNSAAKIYWSDREGAFEVAGIGVAAERTADARPDLPALFAEMRADLSARHGNLRYYGGIRFDLDRARTALWKPFGTYRFVVPQFELGRVGNRHFFAYNVLVDEGEAPADYLDDALRFVDGVELPASEYGTPLPEVTRREDRPDTEAWHIMVGAALDAVKGDALQKVVLARESIFTFSQRLDPAGLLGALIANTTFSFHYAFQFDGQSAFIGASPERLYKRTSTCLKSEALAGTRPRVSEPEQNEMLGRELLRSPKERLEHQFVVDHVRSAFDRHCRAVRGGDKTELLVLRHVQHLMTRFEGMLNNEATDAALLESLHPTPAVGGSPCEDALGLIARLEPFERGWYAGPVGWIGHDSAEFAVAIRSGLVHGNQLSLFSGAGIVPGSNPDEEWAEIENKMGNFLSVLGRRPHV